MKSFLMEDIDTLIHIINTTAALVFTLQIGINNHGTDYFSLNISRLVAFVIKLLTFDLYSSSFWVQGPPLLAWINFNLNMDK